MKDYSHLLTRVSDFPLPGIVFQDVSPLLLDVSARTEIIDLFWNYIQEKNIDVIAGIDARGFILGGMLAQKYTLPFVMLRKDWKMPGELVAKKSYTYEYSSATLTIRKDVLKNNRVLVVDDILATGGTLGAAMHLIMENGGNAVFGGVILEIDTLKGREKLLPYEVFSAIHA